MERIILEVDGALARAWRNSSPSLRATYEGKISAILKELKEVDEDGFTEEQHEFLKAEVAGNMERYEWWNDEEMVAELEQISADMKSGKDKGVPWEEVKANLLNRHKKK